MRILVANPNTTAAMTDRIAAAARSVARPGTEIIALNPPHGPPVIEGPAQGEEALPGLFDLFETVARSPDAVDAAIVACFDDTGLAELKARYPFPVLGIGEAAFHAAMMLRDRFSVVTTLSVSVCH